MGESAHHKALKLIVRDVAVGEGWLADFEVSGKSAAGIRWRADVVATKEKRKIAFELQWSNQAQADFNRRAEPYRDSGMEVTWIHRVKRLVPTPELIEGRVSFDREGGYLITLPGSWPQVLPLTEYLLAIFNKRLSYGFPAFGLANFTVFAANATCWSANCNGQYQVIPFVKMSLGNSAFPSSTVNLSLEEIGQMPELEAFLLNSLDGFSIKSTIKHRYSSTVSTSYLSCGCPKCGRIAGDHYMPNYFYEASQISAFSTSISVSLAELLFDLNGRPNGWMVL